MTENKHKLESNKWFTLEQALEIINNHKESKFKININNIYELFLKSDIALYIKLSYCKGKLSIPNSNIFIDEFHIDGMNYLRCEMLNAEDNKDSINVFYGYARVVKSPFITSLFEVAVFKDEGKLIIDTEYLDKFYLGLDLDEKLKLIKLSPYKGNYLIRAEITKALYTDIESLQYYINSFSMRDIEILGYLDMKDLSVNDSKEYYFGIMRDFALDLKSENPNASYAELYRKSKALMIEKLGLKKDVHIYSEKRFREKFKEEEKDIFL